MFIHLAVQTYTLAINNGPNSLHGGVANWSKLNWTPRIYAAEDGAVGVGA